MALLIRSNLRQLILILALLGALVTVVNMFVTSATVQKQALIKNTLLNNESYADKLADSTQIFLETTQLELAYSADTIARNWHNKNFLKQEVFRISKKNEIFNAVVLVNADGRILNTSNQAIELVGQIIDTEGANQSLKQKTPLITQPYESALNNLIVLISQPIFNEQGVYLGYIGGTIYLKEKNILSRLLGEHYYQDGSYIYVVDQQKRLLYHPKKERLGTAVFGNPVIDEVLKGKNGHAIIRNSEDIEMLSAYAFIPAAQWGVISQRPVESTLEAHEGFMKKIILQSLPINVFMLIFIWFCAWLISAPLRQLTINAKNMKQSVTIKRVKRIKAWYFEAYELKNAFLYGLQNIHDHVGQLREDVRTDPLTGLNNRRSLDYILKKCEVEKLPFSVISLDIDHFKQVNDNYGHDVGDIVIKELATLMKNSSREKDLCIRIGGEEFLIVLPNCSTEIAADIAERLRLTVTNHIFTTAGRITISLGVASWPLHDKHISTVLKLADEMLYKAKQRGRNQVQVVSTKKMIDDNKPNNT